MKKPRNRLSFFAGSVVTIVIGVVIFYDNIHNAWRNYERRENIKAISDHNEEVEKVINIKEYTTFLSAGGGVLGNHLVRINMVLRKEDKDTDRNLTEKSLRGKVSCMFTCTADEIYLVEKYGKKITHISGNDSQESRKEIHDRMQWDWDHNGPGSEVRKINHKQSLTGETK